jgi:hypothetical protein
MMGMWNCKGLMGGYWEVVVTCLMIYCIFHVFRYSYSNEENKKVGSSKFSEESVRELTFTVDGEKLISATSGQDVIMYDVKEGMKQERVLPKVTP